MDEKVLRIVSSEQGIKPEDIPTVLDQVEKALKLPPIPEPPVKPPAVAAKFAMLGLVGLQLSGSKARPCLCFHDGHNAQVVTLYQLAHDGKWGEIAACAVAACAWWYTGVKTGDVEDAQNQFAGWHILYQRALARHLA